MRIDIRIRAFRATEDPETCKKFIKGQRKTLENHGVFKVTSSNNDWANSPAVFVIVVETLDGEKLYGGARIHAANGMNPLPIQEAIGCLDEKIHHIVDQNAQNGTGELCGLWNSKEAASLGIGGLFASRAAVVIAEQIGLQTLFSLCSPATVRFNQWIGSRAIKNIGNEGTFLYPIPTHISTAVFLEDAVNLRNAHPREREQMLFLRQNLRCVITEKAPFKDVTVNVHYHLTIKNATIFEFKINIPAVA